MIETLYPINSLFVYRIIFMAELITSEAIFCIKLNRKKHFLIKLIISIILCFLFALAFPIPTANAFYSMFMFFCFFAFTYFISLFLFDADWRMLLFSLICGYTTEHIAYELYSSLNSFFIAGDIKPGGIYDYNSLKLFSNGLDITFYFVSFINVYWLMYACFARRIQRNQAFDKNDSGKIILIGILFIVIDIILNSAVSYYTEIHYERIYVGIIALINVLLCVFGILFIFELAYSNNLKKEYAIIQELRKEEKKQYKVLKETIDLINIKCHDFRHQIRELGKEQNINEEAISNINKLINIYDQTIKTGNDALNVILTEKSLTCSKYGIKFVCIADGEKLDFIAEEDIYSLFGNILDNAIDATKDLKYEEKIITLKVKNVGNMISISEHNSFDKEIKLEDGLIKSTKNDLLHHGFGLKSIKMVAEKYNGTMNISINNGFTISLLFIR